MATDFSLIPVRANGQTIDASWFNTIRAFLISALGLSSGEVEQSVGLTDSSQDVTALVFDRTEVSEAEIDFQCRRKTDSNEYLESGKIFVQYMKNSASWRLIEGPSQGEDSLIDWDLFVNGDTVTVRESTQSISGINYVGTLKTRYKTWAN